MIAGFEEGGRGRGRAKGCGRAFQAGLFQGNRFSPNSLQKPSPADPFQTSDLHTHKTTDLCGSVCCICGTLSHSSKRGNKHGPCIKNDSKCEQTGLKISSVHYLKETLLHRCHSGLKRKCRTRAGPRKRKQTRLRSHHITQNEGCKQKQHKGPPVGSGYTKHITDTLKNSPRSEPYPRDLHPWKLYPMDLQADLILLHFALLCFAGIAFFFF